MALVVLSLLVLATSALEVSPNHCVSVCATEPVGTPCVSLAPSCDSAPCKCRQPPVEFRQFKDTTAPSGGDIEGWPAGAEVSLEVCRAECLIRSKCLMFTYSDKGECWIKSSLSFVADSAGWLVEQKWWVRPEGPNPPHIEIDNFLTQDVIDKLRNYVADNIQFSNSVSRGNSYWDKKVIYSNSIDDPEVKLLMKMVNYRAAHTLRSFFNVSEPVYPETLLLAEWVPGMDLASHGDNSYYPSGEPNYTPRRTWSSIIYLNSDFVGGELYFVGNGTQEKIQPRAGLMVGFGAGPDYFHGVTKVESGRRFAINQWFSNDPRNYLDLYS